MSCRILSLVDICSTCQSVHGQSICPITIEPIATRSTSARHFHPRTASSLYFNLIFPGEREKRIESGERASFQRRDTSSTHPSPSFSPFSRIETFFTPFHALVFLFVSFKIYLRERMRVRRVRRRRATLWIAERHEPRALMSRGIAGSNENSRRLSTLVVVFRLNPPVGGSWCFIIGRSRPEGLATGHASKPRRESNDSPWPRSNEHSRVRVVRAFNFTGGGGGEELEARPRFESKRTSSPIVRYGDRRVRIISLQISNGTCRVQTHELQRKRERKEKSFFFFVPKL